MKFSTFEKDMVHMATVVQECQIHHKYKWLSVQLPRCAYGCTVSCQCTAKMDVLSTRQSLQVEAESQIVKQDAEEERVHVVWILCWWRQSGCSRVGLRLLHNGHCIGIQAENMLIHHTGGGRNGCQSSNDHSTFRDFPLE